MFQDLNSTLLKHRGFNRRSLWPVTPSSSRGLLGRPMVCRGTVVCGVHGAEGRWQAFWYQGHFSNPSLPKMPADEGSGMER